MKKIVKETIMDIKEILDRLRHNINSKKIGLVGIKESGKTSVLCVLHNEPLPSKDDRTATEKYDEFTLETPNGYIIISKGIDYGGGSEYATNFYNDYIKKNDFIFFGAKY